MITEKEIQSFDKSMSEMFRQHDYRAMYQFYEQVLKPAMQSRQAAVSGCVPYQKCPVCDGFGQVQPNWNRGATSAAWVPCDVCNGAKMIQLAHCR